MDALRSAGLDVRGDWLERAGARLDAISAGAFSRLGASDRERLLLDELVCADLRDSAGGGQYSRVEAVAAKLPEAGGSGEAGGAGETGGAAPEGARAPRPRARGRENDALARVRPFLFGGGARDSALVPQADVLPGPPLLLQVAQRDLGAYVDQGEARPPLELRVLCGRRELGLVITAPGVGGAAGGVGGGAPGATAAGRGPASRPTTTRPTAARPATPAPPPGAACSVPRRLLVPGAKLLVRRCRIHTLVQQSAPRGLFFRRREERPLACWLSCSAADCLFLGGYAPETFEFTPEERTTLLLLHMHSMNRRISALLGGTSNTREVYEALRESLYRAVPEYRPQRPPSVGAVVGFLGGG